MLGATLVRVYPSSAPQGRGDRVLGMHLADAKQSRRIYTPSEQQASLTLSYQPDSGITYCFEG